MILLVIMRKDVMPCFLQNLFHFLMIEMLLESFPTPLIRTHNKAGAQLEDILLLHDPFFDFGPFWCGIHCKFF